MSDLFNEVICKYNTLKNSYKSPTNRCKRFALLRLAVNENNLDLLQKYTNHVESHNKGVLLDPFPNSGFDLFIPNNTLFTCGTASTFVDLAVKGEMIYCDSANSCSEYCGYLVYPRSSISKTPLILANHVGIIDSGYRGSLIAAFKTLSEYTVEKNTRLVQICHPTLCPILVELVQECDLTTSERGAGGFGSTGV